MPDEDEVSVAQRFKRHFSKERFEDYWHPERWFDAEGTRYLDEPDRSGDPGPLGPPEGGYIDPQSGEHVEVRPPPREEGRSESLYNRPPPPTHIDPQSGTRLPVREDEVFYSDLGDPYSSYYDPSTGNYELGPHQADQAPREGEYIDPQSGEHVVPHDYHPRRDVYYDPRGPDVVGKGVRMPEPRGLEDKAAPMPVYKPAPPSYRLESYQTSREPEPLGRLSARKV